MDVNKSAIILAENESALTIVQAANSHGDVFKVTADYVNISGFTVNGTDKAGFYLYDVDCCSISDNNVSNNSKGIYLYSSSNCVLTGNTAHLNSGTGSYKRDGYGCGIYLNYSSNCTLTSNTAYSNNGTGFYNYDSYGYGIYLNYSSNCTLTSNTVYSNSGSGGSGENADEWNEWIGGSGGDGYGHGIYLQHSSNCMLTNNTANSISNGGRGGRGQYGGIGGDGGNSYSCGIYMDYSSNCILMSNTANSISDGGSGGHGLHDADGGDGGDGYGYGIYMDYSSSCILTSNSANSISNGGRGGLGSGGSGGSNGGGYGNGIYLSLSDSNLIYNNHFNNTNNAFDNGYNFWSITKTAGTNIIGGPYLGGNYWSDYEGNDTDGDGLGDTLLPYNSSGNIRSGGDYHPLVQVNSRNEIISIASATLDINDTITVPVTIANASDIQQVVLVLIYDPDVISIINITANDSVLSSTITYSLETGRALIELINSDKITAASATGLIDITFKSVENTGTTVLKLQDIQLIDDAGSHALGKTINGRITVCIKGDFNFNDRVDVGDVAKVAFMVAGKESEDLRPLP